MNVFNAIGSLTGGILAGGCAFFLCLPEMRQRKLLSRFFPSKRPRWLFTGVIFLCLLCGYSFYHLASEIHPKALLVTLFVSVLLFKSFLVYLKYPLFFRLIEGFLQNLFAFRIVLMCYGAMGVALMACIVFLP